MHIRSVLSFVLSCNYAAPQQEKSIEMNKYDEEAFFPFFGSVGIFKIFVFDRKFPGNARTECSDSL